MALDLRERLTMGETSAREAWLAKVVDKIVVSDEKIRIIGRKSNFEGRLNAKEPIRPPIRSSVQEWRPGRESNP